MMFKVSVEPGMLTQTGGKLLLLLLIGEFAIQNEVRSFNEGGILSQFFNWITAISEDAIGPINIGD